MPTMNVQLGDTAPGFRAIRRGRTMVDAHSMEVIA